uniref:CD1871A family CXXC motif-containing protein n=1 Tax=Acetatifactor sp. TaxID=1872090 RepID=UPI004056DB73
MGFWRKNSKKNFPLWTVGVGMGFLFLVIGIYEEQFMDIYRKAVMICLECIGIG